jgi:5-methyltetrahydrofolate--homocysteine methyltransferase
MEYLTEIRTSILEGNAKGVQEGVEKALNDGLLVETVLKDGLIAAMGEVGKLFEEGEYYVPEMLVSARAMQAGLLILKPHLVANDVKPLGRIVLGTVKGDLHDIGKNLVAMMLEGVGFEIIDLGADVSSEEFLKAVKEYQPQIVGISALLTTTIQQMSKIIQALEEAGIRRDVKIIVGGAPVTEDFTQRIGADAYGSDASSAVRVVKSLLSI